MAKQKSFVQTRQQSSLSRRTILPAATGREGESPSARLAKNVGEAVLIGEGGTAAAISPASSAIVAAAFAIASNRDASAGKEATAEVVFVMLSNLAPSAARSRGDVGECPSGDVEVAVSSSHRRPTGGRTGELGPDELAAESS